MNNYFFEINTNNWINIINKIQSKEIYMKLHYWCKKVTKDDGITTTNIDNEHISVWSLEI